MALNSIIYLNNYPNFFNRFFNQNEIIQKLNIQVKHIFKFFIEICIQAHINALLKSDEYIMDYLNVHDKVNFNFEI